MEQLVQIIKHQARERWKDIAEQRLKKYRLSLSPTNKLVVITLYTWGVILGIVVLNVMYGRVQKISIDYTECTEGRCSYAFVMDRPSHSKGQVYVRVNNMPQTHMSYKDTDPRPRAQGAQALDQCEPYLENGRWIYPCGIVDSTYPKDRYTILTSQNKPVFVLDPGVSQASAGENLQSWRAPSSFKSAIHKVGEIEELEKGAYTFVVEKTLNYPEKSREALLVFNLSPFGTVLSNIGPSIVAAAFVLSVINTVACLNYL
ncbi:hypothetical protein NECID01_0112 [Nematocida sp. AWRm77]|nr:hypothetical protein NECID01_0112 [Nematocida sp. AWRm77]